MRRSAVLLSRDAQLLICYCRVFRNDEENIVDASPQCCSQPLHPSPFLPPMGGSLCDGQGMVLIVLMACAGAASHPHAGCWCCWPMFFCVFSMVRRPDHDAACSLLKEIPIPPGTKDSTGKIPQMLKRLPPSRSFLDSRRMGITAISPSHISPRHVPSPSDGRLGRHSRPQKNIITQGLEDYPLASLIGNDFPHSLSLTSAIDINYDN